jgi:hypothetical protein
MSPEMLSTLANRVAISVETLEMLEEVPFRESSTLPSV